MMKKILIPIIILSNCILSSCDKNVITQISEEAVGAKLKVIHAAPGVPAIDVLVNDTKVSPRRSSTITDGGKPFTATIFNGVSYLSTFPNNDYSIQKPENSVVKVVTSTPSPALVSAQTINPGVELINATINFELGKNYSVFAIGLADATSSLMVEDKFPAPVAQKAYVRFINLSPNAPEVDVTGTYTVTGSSTPTVVTPFINVAYKSVTEFTPVDVNPISTTGYVFQLYQTGTTTKIGAATSALNLTAGRYYTIFFRGLYMDYPVPGTGITLKASIKPAGDKTTPEIYFNPPGISLYTNK